MRALLIVINGLGIGSAPDAARFNDQGANTLEHVFSAASELELPTLFSLGLGEIMKGRVFDPPVRKCSASYGRMREQSAGKDTATGLWELAGVVSEKPFAAFERFPDELVGAIASNAKVEFLGNYSCDTGEILNELGEESVRTGKPILFTGPDSVMRIAAHEDTLPFLRLRQICRSARHHCDDARIRRVVAQAFTGTPGAWKPTTRLDYPMVPPRTILNALSERGLPVECVGKVNDVFAHSGVTRAHPTASNEESLAVIEQIWSSPQNGLIFADLSDFDTLYGHRRDPEGYARALEAFDDWLADFLEEIESDDLLIITGDHGNDPTFRGADHTREEVPVIVKYDGRTGPLGIRESFTDVAATLMAFFGLSEPREKWGAPLITFHRPSGFQIL
ncbi:MAG: phosphopentomutase [Verrucomicrobiota bacterium]